MKEIWEPVTGYKKFYEVSNFGRIKRLSAKIFVIDKHQNRTYFKSINEKIIHQFFDNNGYKTVNILGHRMRVHRLVAIAFLPKIDGKNIVNHIDGKKSNNNLNNLEWCSALENCHHAIRIGLLDTSKLLHQKKTVVMCTKLGEELKQFDSITSAYAFFGEKYQGGISEVCQGKRNYVFGYRWKYGE